MAESLTLGLSLALVHPGLFQGRPSQLLNRQEKHITTADPVRNKPDCIGNHAALCELSNKQSREIRLLQLCQQQRSSCRRKHISFDMTKASLDDPNTQYDALSYGWGAAERSSQIEINGTKISVTDNLYDSLSTLSKPGKLTRAIWVDAICINQQDTTERNHQVSLMEEIYGRAETVHIYIGQESAHTTSTFSSVDQIAAGVSVRSLIASNQLTNAHLRDLFTCTWWTRLWILQEATLARHPLLHWGSESIPFWRLVDSMAVARSAKIDGHFDTCQEHHQDSQGKWVYNFDRAMHSFLVLKGQQLPPDLVLSVSSSSDVTDERDRVYGVLALMPTLKHTRPDYSLSPYETFLRTSIDVMRQQRSLRLLRLVRRAGDAPTKPGPSWLPSFSGIGGLIGVHRDNFGSQGTHVTESFSLEEVGSRGLRIKAFNVDVIEIVGSSCRLDDEHCRNFTAQDPGAQEHFRQVLRTWLGLTTTLKDRHPLHSNVGECFTAQRERAICTSFWETMLCGGLFNFVTGSKNYTLDVVMKVYDDWLHQEGKKKALSVYLYLQLQLLVGGSTFFITKAGRIGLSRSDVEVDDAVALLGGEVIPYVLRQRPGAGATTLQLVGSCFCNGLMYGEPISEVTTSPTCRSIQAGTKDIYDSVVLT